MIERYDTKPVELFGEPTAFHETALTASIASFVVVHDAGGKISNAQIRNRVFDIGVMTYMEMPVIKPMVSYKL